MAWRWGLRQASETPPSPPTAAEVQGHAREVVDGAMSRDAFLGWLHAAVGHDGPDKYLDLVEMGCAPEAVDAGEGRWWRESAEAKPLRDWTDRAIAALARGASPSPLPDGWDDLMWLK